MGMATPREVIFPECPGIRAVCPAIEVTYGGVHLYICPDTYHEGPTGAALRAALEWAEKGGIALRLRDGSGGERDCDPRDEVLRVALAWAEARDKAVLAAKRLAADQAASAIQAAADQEALLLARAERAEAVASDAAAKLRRLAGALGSVISGLAPEK